MLEVRCGPKFSQGPRTEMAVNGRIRKESGVGSIYFGNLGIYPTAQRVTPPRPSCSVMDPPRSQTLPPFLFFSFHSYSSFPRPFIHFDLVYHTIPHRTRIQRQYNIPCRSSSPNSSTQTAASGLFPHHIFHVLDFQLFPSPILFCRRERSIYQLNPFSSFPFVWQNLTRL